MFLSGAHQREVDFLHSWVVILNKCLDQINGLYKGKDT